MLRHRSTFYALAAAALASAAVVAWGAAPTFRTAALRAAVERDDPPAVERLLAEGAPAGATMGRNGETLLMHAAARGRTALVRALLTRGADPMARDESGRTALIRAASRGHRETLQLLTDSAPGADIGQTDALIYAVRRGDPAAAGLLLESGADPNAAGGLHGDTALLVAVDRGDARMVALLIAAGADPNGAGGLGESPLARVRREPKTPERVRIAGVLRKAGAR